MAIDVGLIGAQEGRTHINEAIDYAFGKGADSMKSALSQASQIGRNNQKSVADDVAEAAKKADDGLKGANERLFDALKTIGGDDAVIHGKELIEAVQAGKYDSVHVQELEVRIKKDVDAYRDKLKGAVTQAIETGAAHAVLLAAGTPTKAEDALAQPGGSLSDAKSRAL